jgi:hypothetical protein
MKKVSKFTVVVIHPIGAETKVVSSYRRYRFEEVPGVVKTERAILGAVDVVDVCSRITNIMWCSRRWLMI